MVGNKSNKNLSYFAGHFIGTIFLCISTTLTLVMVDIIYFDSHLFSVPIYKGAKISFYSKYKLLIFYNNL